MIGRQPWNKDKIGVYSPETIQAMSDARSIIIPWNKGLNKFIDERVANCSGENSPHWQGGRSEELYTNEFIKVIRKSIRQRDRFVCQECKENGFCVHHIDYNKKNNDTNNLITLCRSCHTKTNYNRNYWEDHFKSKLGTK